MGSGDREMEIYPKLYHEILNEEDWGDVTRRMLRWMEQHRRDAFKKQDAATKQDAPAQQAAEDPS